MVRNESPYLAEWLEFHRMVGVEHVYLYDNRSTDALEATVAPFVDDGFVTLIDASDDANLPSGGELQRIVYADAIGTHGGNWRWMAIIDADEFLFPAEGSSMSAALRQYDDLSALVVPWTNFGHSGHLKRPQGLVIESYTQSVAPSKEPAMRQLLKWKTIVWPEKVLSVRNPHFCGTVAGVGGFDERGVFIASNRDYPGSTLACNRLRLNHYYLKSKAEFEVKLQKGWFARIHDERVQRAEYIEGHAVYDDAALRFVPDLKRRLAEIASPVPAGEARSHATAMAYAAANSRPRPGHQG